ncbi:MAG TPA: Hpt domain-containing protein, partial [Spirochaetia bacterium]|nr:Hpt domain-containing protein [Spirochaetia bacterium]
MKSAMDPEVLENLEHLETDLVAYETGLSRGRDETGRVQFIFRYAHNLKSSLGMLGFTQASNLLHRVESCFDLVRNAKRRATADLARASLAALDLV